MIMSKKGFTLVEMIAVLVILSILFLISFTSITNLLKKGDNRISIAEDSLISDALKSYTEARNIDSETFQCISFNKLIEDGLIDKKMFNDVDFDSNIVFAKRGYDVHYIISNDSCSTYNSNFSVNFKLNGEEEMVVQTGSTFSDPWVTLTYMGTDLSSSVSVRYYDKNHNEVSSIVTTEPTNYFIEYYISDFIDNDKELSIERIVNVVSNDLPVITHPGDTYLAVNQTSFNILSGVSARDKDGNALSFTAKTNLSLGIMGTYTITYSATDKNGNTASVNRLIIVKKPYTERLLNGADPTLNEKMFPVIYDEDSGKWVVASLFEDWYSYKERRWANVVILRSGVEPLKTGDIVNIDDVNSFMVYIPRYSYKINWRGDNQEYNSSIGPKAISITFNSKDKAIAKDYRIHNGFEFGGVKKTGIWIDKFESSLDPAVEEATGGNKDLSVYRSIPDVVSMGDRELSTNYRVIWNMQELITGTSNRDIYDVHIVKTMEWGAVTYLAYSIYGRCDTPDHCTEVSLNDSTGYYTGRSAGNTVVTKDTVSTNGTYRYNDLTYGVMASTTGNIYGVYDMAGGRAEQNFSLVLSVNGNPTAGYCNGTTFGTRCNSATSLIPETGLKLNGFNGDISKGGYGDGVLRSVTNETPLPDSKYYDLYPFTPKYTTNGACETNPDWMPGDAIGEMLPQVVYVGDTAQSFRITWFGDGITTPNGAYPVLVRGGSSQLGLYNDYDKIGIFTASDSAGMSNATLAYQKYTTRKILIVD